MADDFLFNEYMNWLMDHAIDYDRFVCNGDMLLEVAELGVGYEDFLKEYFVLDTAAETV